MKIHTKTYLISLGSLLIITTIFISSINKIFLNKDYEKKIQNSFFNYKERKNVVGFNHINFKQFEIYNPIEMKYEFYLNEQGKKYLIKRFMETTIIGPEISALKSIIIGDTNVLNKHLGSYYTIGNFIFINPLINIKKYGLWYNEKLLQEKRAEAILSILSHEYNHHIFDSYVSSPIGYSHKNPNSQPRSNVQFIKSRLKEDQGDIIGIWNKTFYEDFKTLFFSSGPIKNTKRIKNEIIEKYTKKIKNIIKKNTDFSKKQLLNEIIEWIDEWNSEKNIYDVFNDVGKIFESINENSNYIKNISIEKDIFLLLGVIMNFDRFDFPYNPTGYKIHYKNIDYNYSISEQTTRKLLLSSFTKKRNSLENFRGIENEYLLDNLYSNSYIENNWYRFYSDNIYPSYLQKSKNNLGKKFIENIIDSMFGHKNQSNLSFITHKNSWNIISENKSINPNEDWKNDYNKIKIGGFIDNNEYNYIGYHDKNGNIRKYPIIVKKFNIWYKNQIEDQNKQLLNEDYYWYTKNYIDKNEFIGKKLIFIKSTNEEVELLKNFKNIRKNKYGIVNNFNSEINQDEHFKEFFVEPIGLGGKKWLIIGDNSDGVRLKNYEKQEEIEKIWK